MEKNFCIRAFEIDCPESVHLSPDGKYVISFGSSDKTMIWELSSGNLINTIDGMTWNTLSQDGKYLAGEWSNKKTLNKGLKLIKIVEFPNCNTIKTLEIRKNPRLYIRSVEFSPDNEYIATIMEDFETENVYLEIWDIESDRMVKTFGGYNWFLISPQWHYIVLIDNRKFYIKELWSDSLINIIDGDEQEPWTFAISPNEQYFVVGYGENLDELTDNPTDPMYLKVWDMKTGDVIQTFEGLTLGPSALLFSPNGKYIISAWEGTGKLITWSILSGNCVLNINVGHASSLSFSKDGKLLANSSYDNFIKVWDFKGLIQEKERIERERREERKRKRKLELKNRTTIKRTLLDYSTKFTRIQVNEIIEKTKINDEKLIIDIILDMIKNKEIYAEYFSTSKAVVFDQQANIEDIDKLMKAYQEWEEKKVGKK